MHSLVILSWLAASASLVVAAPGAACSSGMYRSLLSLSNYAPAESYCSANYPLPTVTVTSDNGGSQNAKRWAPYQPMMTPTTRTTTTTSTTTTSSCTAPWTSAYPQQQWQWSSVLSGGSDFMSTVCSCIEVPVTITVQPSTTTTSTTTTTTTTTTTDSS